MQRCLSPFSHPSFFLSMVWGMRMKKVAGKVGFKLWNLLNHNKHMVCYQRRNYQTIKVLLLINLERGNGPMCPRAVSYIHHANTDGKSLRKCASRSLTRKCTDATAASAFASINQSHIYIYIYLSCIFITNAHFLHIDFNL